ncbi:hypothetical protein KUTeg_016337 [Tegillarca granosa]|uniref:Eukaryotic translation initiation factor 3 subunit E n=1 Tax=Tegillarca granosa TaxID=220873 RepID=A0ABQ9EPD1_TEGGR|nr:hypothetical protein KUTeg_016337 [Tegillarca granosa]
MAEFDLTSRMGQYLDRHLVFPLLEFLSVKELYDEKEMLKGKLDLLSNTNMVDFAMDVHKNLYPDQDVPQKTELITKIFEDPEVVRQMQSSRDGRQLFEFLNKDYGLPSSDKNFLDTLWGKLASEILMQNWETALDDLTKLKDVIDNNTTCPHILRYLTTAVITNKGRRRQVLKDLVKVIQQESYTYRDPITEFVECLYVNFDFDGAQQKLRECEEVLVNDFFLVACLDDFIENARLLIFETFCRIHECISINMLAEKLNMTVDDAERWIVNLIRNARLDAKIDSKLGHVVMGAQAVSPYQQVIEKTKNLAFRSQMLAMNIEKKLGVRSNDNMPQWGQE